MRLAIGTLKTRQTALRIEVSKAMKASLQLLSNAYEAAASQYAVQLVDAKTRRDNGAHDPKPRQIIFGHLLLVDKNQHASDHRTKRQKSEKTSPERVNGAIGQAYFGVLVAPDLYVCLLVRIYLSLSSCQDPSKPTLPKARNLIRKSKLMAPSAINVSQLHIVSAERRSTNSGAMACR
jgi:hypothetical protein